MPTGSDLVLLFAAGIITGLMNAVAGGGSFVAFPALLLVGIPAISANVTSPRFPGNSPASGPIATTSAVRPSSISSCCWSSAASAD